MFKKVEEYFKKKQEAIQKEQELRKAQKFYSFVKAGSTFIKFIQEDLSRQENGMNRVQRRRFEKELNEKGVLSPELISFYQQKLDWVLKEVDARLNPPKQPKGYNPPPINEVRPNVPTPPPPDKKCNCSGCTTNGDGKHV